MSRCWLIGTNNLSSSQLHCCHNQMNHPQTTCPIKVLHLPLPYIYPALTWTVAVLFMYHLCWPHKQTVGRLHHREGSALAETDKLTVSKRSRLGCITQRFHSSNSSHIYHLGQAVVWQPACDTCPDGHTSIRVPSASLPKQGQAGVVCLLACRKHCTHDLAAFYLMHIADV